MIGLNRQRKGFFVITFLYFLHNIMPDLYDAVNFIYMMRIWHSLVNLYFAVSVCSLFLVREVSCPSVKFTSSHSSLNVQFSHKPPCMLQPYTATCHCLGIVFCIVFYVVIFCVV